MNEKSAMRVAFLAACVVSLLAFQVSLLGQNEVAVNTIVVAVDVTDRTPVDPGTEFSPDVGELYCFTAVNNPGDRVTLTHVWSHEGEEVARVDITVGRSPNWRAWSVKSIDPDRTGSWTVTVVDTAGTQIASTGFKVVAEPEMAPEMPEMEEMEMEEPEMEMEEPMMEEMEMEESEMEEMEMPEPEAESDTATGQ